MMTDRWIAIDWGTSALRVWRMAGTRLEAHRHSDAGMGRLHPGQFEGALLDLVADWVTEGPLRAVACGMVGARQGWQEATYRALPCAPIGAPLLTLHPADRRLTVHVVPGLCQPAPADVMRGEETQIAGLLVQEPGFDGIVGLPGTHMKWARVAAGVVRQFQTCMTGELFDLLAGQSVLRHSVGPGWDETAFAAALAEMRAAPERLIPALFGLRAEGLLHAQSPDAARARLSGLLIGAELAATRALWEGQDIVLIGSTGLAARYQTALAAFGQTARLLEAETATLAGLAEARRLIGGENA